jgi:ABC-type uncharacterized transport system substrate-binding protein
MGEARPLVQLDYSSRSDPCRHAVYAENPGHLAVVKDTVWASTQLGLQRETHGVRGANDLAEVFQAAVRGRAQALLVQDDVTITLLKRPIVDRAARQSLPVFAQYREFAEVGALVTFAHALTDEYRLAASYSYLESSKPATSPYGSRRSSN